MITEDSLTQIEQIGEQQFMITGGHDKSQRFTFYDKENIWEGKMRKGRYWHRTVYDGKKRQYIISGELGKKLCEVFDLEEKTFNQIKDIWMTNYLFGAFMNEIQKIYVLGGTVISHIQVYNCARNEWQFDQCPMPEAAKVTAGYMEAPKAGIMYSNDYQDTKIVTYIFDLKNFQRHGQAFWGEQPTFTQPYAKDQKVYQFGYYSDLYVYSLLAPEWQKVVI